MSVESREPADRHSNLLAGIWPPPTAGMTCNQLITARKIAVEFANHCKEEIPVACGKEGHLWDSAEGKYRAETIMVGGSSPGPFGGEADHGYPERIERFERTCTRCGKVQSASPVKQEPRSPFVSC